MQGSRIEVSVHGCRKEDERGSLGGPDLQWLVVLRKAGGGSRNAIVVVILVDTIIDLRLRLWLLHQLRKGRLPAAGDVVEIHQHGDGSLPPVGRKASPVCLLDVKSVVVGKVLLGVEVSAHLREFHVADRFGRELRDLADQGREVLPGDVARGRGPCLADDPRADAHDGRRGEGIGGDVDQVVALFFGQKVFDPVDGWIAVDLAEARIEGIDAVEDRDGSRVLLKKLLLLMLLLMLMQLVMLLLLVVVFLRALLGRIMLPLVLALRIMDVVLLGLLRNHGGDPFSSVQLRYVTLRWDAIENEKGGDKGNGPR